MATGILDSRELLLGQTSVAANSGYVRDGNGWSPDSFTREQIRGLVRQIFFSNIAQPVRQVAFSAAEAQTDVGSICRQVGEALALETQASIAVDCKDFTAPEEMGVMHKDPVTPLEEPSSTNLRDTATRLRSNLWLVPDAGYFSPGDVVPVGLCPPRLGYSRLAELRREFDYSIVECPSAGESSTAAALGQMVDGIILVLAAHRTRRATARKIMERLRSAQVQLLGTVLSDRTFPVPEGIYRRL